MTDYPFRILNVFTRERAALSGNPLCVFESGESLDAATMQALALQFNLSETTFILPATAASATARVRIFTPRYEMPFAGHPTLGTAHVCRALGSGSDHVRLEMAAGLVEVGADGDRWTLTAPGSNAREFGAANSVLATALGLEEADIGPCPLWVNAGNEQLIVPLTSAVAVQRAAPRAEAFLALETASVTPAPAGVRAASGSMQAFVFSPISAERIAARFFFQQGPVVLEDPATGSAAANLGGWQVALDRPLPWDVEILQGELTGRPSTLHLRVTAVGRILVGGDVVEIGRGRIQLDAGARMMTP
jgi:PhzF family phenazine biosynthesis protein